MMLISQAKLSVQGRKITWILKMSQAGSHAHPVWLPLVRRSSVLARCTIDRHSLAIHLQQRSAPHTSGCSRTQLSSNPIVYYLTRLNVSHGLSIRAQQTKQKCSTTILQDSITRLNVSVPSIHVKAPYHRLARRQNSSSSGAKFRRRTCSTNF